jgi:hypothetical protein
VTEYIFPKLKPCPCCGKSVQGTTSYQEGYPHVYIECVCGIRTHEAFHSLPVCKKFKTGNDGVAEVSKIWNNRRQRE